MGVEVIDRCNLTVLQEPGQEDLADFLAEHKVLISIHSFCALQSSTKQDNVGIVYAAFP